jgi:hypothetical protein
LRKPWHRQFPQTAPAASPCPVTGPCFCKRRLSAWLRQPWLSCLPCCAADISGSVIHRLVSFRPRWVLAARSLTRAESGANDGFPHPGLSFTRPHSFDRFGATLAASRHLVAPAPRRRDRSLPARWTDTEVRSQRLGTYHNGILPASQRNAICLAVVTMRRRSFRAPSRLAMRLPLVRLPPHFWAARITANR